MRQDVEKLFNKQLQVLSDRGCSAVIIDSFTKQRDIVIVKMLAVWIKKYANMSIKRIAEVDFHLGIPVIPLACVGLDNLMKLVKLDDNLGQNTLDPNLVVDIEKSPNNPYYIFDVLSNNGTQAMRGNDREYSLLTVAEAIAVCAQRNLWMRSVAAFGSRYRYGSLSNPRVPYVDLYNKKMPILTYMWLASSSI
ncbi:MAG: hypothetical protein AAB721_01085 [Patescibacteria group bacterium]